MGFCRNDFRGSMQIARAGVVAKPLPGMKNIVLRRARQRIKIWETAQPLLVIRQNARDLGLLKHELGDEDCVRILSPTPREIAPVFVIPV